MRSNGLKAPIVSRVFSSDNRAAWWELGRGFISLGLFRDGIALRGDGLAGHDGCRESGGVWQGAVYDLTMVQSLVDMGLNG